MKMPDAKVIVFNAAAVLITGAAVVGLLRSVLIKPTSVPCSERYHHSTAFALERGGVLLTAADLQSRLAGKDVGVIDNVSIARVADWPGPRRHHRAPAQGLDVAARLAQGWHQLSVGPAVGAGQDGERA